MMDLSEEGWEKYSVEWINKSKNYPVECKFDVYIWSHLENNFQVSFD